MRVVLIMAACLFDPKTTSQYGWKLVVDTWFEQLFFIITCEIQSHVFVFFKQNKTTDPNNVLFFPFFPVGPTGPPRAWPAIENIMFHEVPLGGIVFLFEALNKHFEWTVPLTTVCRSSIFISAT